ncbi:rhamnosyltransferase subunit A [Robbsia andropogonis]
MIHRFKPKFLYSVSWGGLASLLALAREPSSIKRAVIGSFSPFLNPAMVDYVTRARAHIHAGENLQAAQLLNDTVGKHLPRMLKHTNYMYLTSLPETEQKQVAFHVEQILALQPESYMHCLSSIQSKVKFINGDLDEYTTSADIRTLGRYIPDAEFETVANTGHFLELEGREQAAAMQEALMDFFGGGQRWDHPVMPQPIVTPALMRSAAVANYEAVQ